MNQAVKKFNQALDYASHDSEDLAIIQLRGTWVEQKMSEHANASITAFYNRPREEDA